MGQMTKDLIPVVIDDITDHDDKPITWLANKSCSVRALFPHWLTAEVMLKEFVTLTTDWIIKTEQTQLFIGLGFPIVKDELTGTMFPMILTFPPEVRSKVIQICNNLMKDYLPNMDCYRHEKLTEATIGSIKASIRQREHKIVSQGGRLVLEELKFRFGFGGIHHIMLEVVISDKDIKGGSYD